MNVEQLIADARELAQSKVLFLHQGRDPRFGLDCLGVLEYLGKRQGYCPDVPYSVAYPRSPNGRALFRQLCQSQHLTRIDLSEARRGDLLQVCVRRNPQHLAIQTSDGTPPLVVHAEAVEFGRVVEQPLTFPVFAAFRFTKIISE